MLWLCVHLPQFSLQVHTRALDNKARPVAISRDRLIWDCNEPARNAGVHAGMRISAAQALCGALPMNLRPEAALTFPRQPIHSLPYLLGGCSRRRSTSSIHGVVHPCSRLPPGEGDPKGQVRERPPGSGVQFAATARPGGLSIIARDRIAEAAALERLAGWTGQFSCCVSLAPPGSLLVEIGGSLKLFGGLHKLSTGIQQGLADLGFNACLAVAPTPLSALLFARSGGRIYITELAKLASALAPVPLKFLPVAPEILAALADLGLTTLGDCLRLPRAGLLRRFGCGFIDYLDRALGRAPDPVQRYLPPAYFESRLPFPEEVLHSDALLFAVSRLVAELTGFLRATDTGVQRIDIDLLAQYLPPQRLTLGLVAPNRDAAHLLGLLRERIQRLELQSPVQEMVLRADTLIPWQATTRKLFKEAGLPQKNPAVLIEQLQARLGVAAVNGIAEVPDHRPHRAWRYCGPMSARGSAARVTRPLWLLPEPAPIEGPHLPRLQKIHGPERIEGGWWDGEDIARDYFIAIDDRGTALWIFTERRGERRWFIHGMFA